MDCVVSLFAADRRAQFESLEYTEEDYQKELEHIEKVNISVSLQFLISMCCLFNPYQFISCLMCFI